jgi:hypothetical protein
VVHARAGYAALEEDFQGTTADLFPLRVAPHDPPIKPNRSVW